MQRVKKQRGQERKAFEEEESFFMVRVQDLWEEDEEIY